MSNLLLCPNFTLEANLKDLPSSSSTDCASASPPSASCCPLSSSDELGAPVPEFFLKTHHY